MKQITPGAPARKSSSHPRAATATVTNVMRPSQTTVGQYDHVAAAAYLMKHAATTALTVVNAQTGQPAGIITEADIDRAITDGKDINDVRVHAIMTAAGPSTPTHGAAASGVPRASRDVRPAVSSTTPPGTVSAGIAWLTAASRRA